MRNLTLLTDMYQLTAAQVYFKRGLHERRAVFDLFFREKGRINYACAAGLQQACEYLEDFRFEREDLEYLRGLNLFDGAFLKYLSGLRFGGDVFSVPEGTVVFPDEPILTVDAPLLQAQLAETALLNIINHQTLIATKASYLCEAAGGAPVMEFGLRRAHGPDAGLYGARAAVIGGASSTSDVLGAKTFNLKLTGTMSHAFVMAFPDELSAFRAFAAEYPDNCTLLVDTYDTLSSGVPNAIKVFSEFKKRGRGVMAVRLDSGDIAYLSKKTRAMLDAADLCEVKIAASGDLDEHLILALKVQGARIDAWGVGTKLITGAGQSLGGVYKMAAFEGADGKLAPTIKISDALVKITNPGMKELYRFYSADGKAAADLIALKDEALKFEDGFTLVHPVERWKQTRLSSFTVKKLFARIFKDGRRVYECPDALCAAEYHRAEKATFWEEIRRADNPQIYKVDLSDKLYELKTELLRRAGKR